MGVTILPINRAMKTPICTLVLVMIALSAFAQEEELESITNILNVAVRVDLPNGQISAASLPPQGVSSLTSLQIRHENGDLVLDYQLASPSEDNMDRFRYYEVVPAFSLDGRPLSISPYDDLRGDHGSGNPLAPGAHQLRWKHPLERYPYLQGSLQVTLQVTTRNKVIYPYPCELGEPEFTARQRLPYFVAAGVGAASIGLGQLFRSQRDEVYENQYKVQTKLSDAEPLYQDANNKHHLYQILTYAGAGILLADATLYLIRQRKFKRNFELWKSCPEYKAKLGVEPTLGVPGGGGSGGSVGMRISLSF